MKTNFTLLSVIVLSILGSMNSIAQVPTYVNQTDMLGWYALDGNGSDASTNGNDLLNNGAVAGQDRFGSSNGAMSFDPSQQAHLTRPNYPFTQSEFCTISAWFKQGTPTSSAAIAHRGDEISQERTIILRMGASNPESLVAQSWLNSGGANMGHAAPGTSWYHAVFVRSGNGNIGRLYVNGEEVATVSVNNYMTDGVDFYVGAAGDGTGTTWHFNGELDDIGVWNGEIDACGVKKLYYAYEVENPVDATAPVGGTATFTLPEAISPPGGGSPSFTWQVNSGTGWQDLSNAGQYSGVGTNELTVSDLTSSNNNNLFRCIIDYDGVCEELTEEVTLTIGTSGIFDRDEFETVAVYPNPSNGLFQLDLTDTKFSANAQVVVMDNTGKEIYNAVANSTRPAVDLSAFANGVYMIRVVEDEFIGTSRVTIK